MQVVAYKNRLPRQCWNCQRWNHGSDSCRMDPVCLKCAGKHKMYNCTKRKDTPATCANCKGAHPANFSGCQFLPTNIRNKRPTLNTIKNATTYDTTSEFPPLYKHKEINTDTQIITNTESNQPTFAEVLQPPPPPTQKHQIQLQICRTLLKC